MDEVSVCKRRLDEHDNYLNQLREGYNNGMSIILRELDSRIDLMNQNSDNLEKMLSSIFARLDKLEKEGE